MKFLHETPTIYERVKVIQIIWAALILFAVGAMAVVFFQADKQKMGMSFDVITTTFAGMAALAYLGSFVVPVTMRDLRRKSGKYLGLPISTVVAGDSDTIGELVVPVSEEPIDIAAESKIEALSAEEKLDMQSNDSIEPSDDRKIELATVACLETEIIRAALVEVGAMSNAMIFVVEPSLFSLIVAGLGIILMIVFFPTHRRIANKVRYLTGM